MCNIWIFLQKTVFRCLNDQFHDCFPSKPGLANYYFTWSLTSICSESWTLQITDADIFNGWIHPCHPNNSVKALKGNQGTDLSRGKTILSLLDSPLDSWGSFSFAGTCCRPVVDRWSRSKIGQVELIEKSSTSRSSRSNRVDFSTSRVDRLVDD